MKTRIEHKMILKGVALALVAGLAFGLAGTEKSFATTGQSYAGYPHSRYHHHHHMMMRHNMMNER